jgi:hypothetical protein
MKCPKMGGYCCSWDPGDCKDCIKKTRLHESRILAVRETIK